MLPPHAQLTDTPSPQAQLQHQSLPRQNRRPLPRHQRKVQQSPRRHPSSVSGLALLLTSDRRADPGHYTVTLVYPTLDLALHGFVAAFGRRGVPLVKANGRLRLEVPGRPVIAVASSASKYKAGDTPLSALLDLALKQDFVRIRE